jgi:hypothetical protein
MAGRTNARRQTLKGRTNVAKRTNEDSTPQQDRYLLLTEERTHDGYLGRYFHMRVRVVTDKYERGERVPYGNDDTYGDGPLYSGLRGSCQGDDQSAVREGADQAVYGYREMEYHDVYTLDLRKARRMCKTLEAINRKLDKLSEARGYCRSWGEWIGRVAEALGCKGIVIDRGQPDASGYRYRWESIGDGINAANNAVWRWQRETKERLQPAGEEAAS